jgi:hypothetical protein
MPLVGCNIAAAIDISNHLIVHALIDTSLMSGATRALQNLSRLPPSLIGILKPSGGIRELLPGCCSLGRKPKNNRT